MTRKSSIISLAALAAIITTLTPGSAEAQGPTTGATPATNPGTTTFVLIELNGWEELMELYHYVERYYALVLNEQFATGAKDSARRIFDKAKKGELLGKFQLLFDSFDQSMKAFGSELPKAMHEKMLAHLKASGCEFNPSTKTWSGNCDSVYDEVVSQISELLPKAKQGELLNNAKTLLEFSRGYEGGDKIILAYGALGLLVTQVPVADRPTNWKLDKTPYEQAKAALDAGKGDFYGFNLPPVVNQQVMEKAKADGVEVCVYEKGAMTDPDCGNVDNVTPNGFTAVGKEIKYAEIPNRYIVSVGKMNKPSLFEQAMQAKNDGKSGFAGHTFAPDQADEATYKPFEGQEAVVLDADKEPHKGIINNVSPTGFKVGDREVAFTQITNKEVIVTLGEKVGDGNGEEESEKNRNKGFYFGVGFVYNAVIAGKDENGEREITTAHLPGADINAGWSAKKMPMRFGVGVQLTGQLGGIDSHYTQLISGGQRLLVMPYGQFAFNPRIGEKQRLGLDANLLIGGFTSGGWAVLAGLDLCGHFNWGDVCGGISLGHMNTGKASGGNTTSSLPDPKVAGFAVGGNAGVKLYPGNWGKGTRKAKKDRKAAKASGEAGVSTQ